MLDIPPNKSYNYYMMNKKYIIHQTGHGVVHSVDTLEEAIDFIRQIEHTRRMIHGQGITSPFTIITNEAN